MAGECGDSSYWDILTKTCRHCRMVCKWQHILDKCTSYCEFANCRAQPGHFHDGLLKKCMRCVDVCGRHPAECSQHCQPRPPPVPTEKLPLDVNTHAVSIVLLYALLSLCMVLLLLSLCLALVVFLRGTKASKTGSKKRDRSRDGAVQCDQEIGQPGFQSGHSSKDSVTNSSHPSEDSSPTETCVCVHCFPDLKAAGLANGRPARAPFSFYPQAVFNKAPIQKREAVWTEGVVHASGWEVEDGPAEG